MVSRITDKILPIAKEWQQRPLETIYAVDFPEAIHYPVPSEGQIVKKAVYIYKFCSILHSMDFTQNLGLTWISTRISPFSGL